MGHPRVSRPVPVVLQQLAFDRGEHVQISPHSLEQIGKAAGKGACGDARDWVTRVAAGTLSDHGRSGRANLEACPQADCQPTTGFGMPGFAGTARPCCAKSNWPTRTDGPFAAADPTRRRPRRSRTPARRRVAPSPSPGTTPSRGCRRRRRPPVTSRRARSSTRGRQSRRAPAGRSSARPSRRRALCRLSRPGVVAYP